MFIKVERDIVDVILHHQRNKKRERAIDVMVQLMTASRLNNHKVYLKWNLNNGENNDLRLALDENSWREFCRLQKERIDVEGLIDVLDVYVIVTISKHSSRVGKMLLINPFDVSDFFFDTSTYLCTENQRDGKFYQIVCDYYLSKERTLNMTSRYKTWKGGGSDFGNALKEDHILNENFLFAIADSDKSYPEGKIGRTAKSIMFLGHNRYNADYYILTDVAEIENLIPTRVIKEYNPNIINIENTDLSYFDFKEGLKLQILYDKKCRKYWQENFANVIIQWTEIEKLVSDKSFSDYCKIVHNRPSLVLGCGNKLLDSLLENGDWTIIREEDFTKSQLLEWEKIGKRVFSWTCCSKKKV